MPFLPPNQQRQSTEGIITKTSKFIKLLTTDTTTMLVLFILLNYYYYCYNTGLTAFFRGQPG